MADAMLSAAAARLIALIAEQARYHVNLVRGAEKEVRSLAEKLESIRIVLDDAENRRFKDKKINYWMSRLEATAYEMEDILDEWDYAILKLHMDEHDSDDVVVAPAPKQKIPGEIGKLINLRSLRLCGNESLKELPREIKNLIHLRLLELSRNKSLKELPKEIGNLIQLRHLIIKKNDSLKELPSEIGNLIHLRRLNLQKNQSLKGLPKEIGNLIQLRHLIIGKNDSVKELPSEIGNLIHLRCLDVGWNKLLRQLPDSICRLHELQTLNAYKCLRLLGLPKGVAQLTGLRFVSVVAWGCGWSKLGLLKNLNHLAGVLSLAIILKNNEDFEEVVEDARDAELRNKIHTQKLEISFLDQIDEMEEEESSRVRMDVLDALETHPNLQKLSSYQGSKLPLGWIVSPLNQLRKVKLSCCNNLTSLLPFGKLPCLEMIHLNGTENYVRRH
ncbi:hypothetical protein ACS0TY_004986 [Phlomoides rotata]